MALMVSIEAPFVRDHNHYLLILLIFYWQTFGCLNHMAWLLPYVLFYQVKPV